MSQRPRGPLIYTAGYYRDLGWDPIMKFGYAPDIRTTTDPTDVWIRSNNAQVDLQFPSAAATTTLDSTSTSDDGDPAGTGARTVTVEGLDANGQIVRETGTMDGTTAVTLTTSFQSVYRAWVATAGSGGKNAGTVTVLHGATVLAEIGLVNGEGVGQTLQAGYTVPTTDRQGNAIKTGVIVGWMTTSGKQTAATATVGLLIRESGSGSWRVHEVHNIHNTGGVMNHMYPLWLEVPVATDIKMRVFEVSATTAISGSFDVLLVK